MNSCSAGSCGDVGRPSRIEAFVIHSPALQKDASACNPPLGGPVATSLKSPQTRRAVRFGLTGLKMTTAAGIAGAYEFRPPRPRGQGRRPADRISGLLRREAEGIAVDDHRERAVPRDIGNKRRPVIGREFGASPRSDLRAPGERDGG